MSEKLLDVKDLKMHFPVKGGIIQRAKKWCKAVDGVSLSIAPGETLGLVGESGCGKSTLGKCIVRLNKPTAGSIFYDGVDLAGVNNKTYKPYRRDIQMVFQDPFSSLNPRMMVADIVGEPLRIHKMASGLDLEKRVDEMLERVGIKRQQRSRYPHAFSGGQRQRIGIARSLIMRPRLVVADEPVSALDVSVQAQVLNLLKELQVELGITYLFVAHNLDVVRHFCDRVAVMNKGSIVELSETEELFTAPQHPYTRLLLDSILPPDPRARKRMRQENTASKESANNVGEERP